MEWSHPSVGWAAMEHHAAYYARVLQTARSPELADWRAADFVHASQWAAFVESVMAEAPSTGAGRAVEARLEQCARGMRLAGSGRLGAAELRAARATLWRSVLHNACLDGRVAALALQHAPGPLAAALLAQRARAQAVANVAVRSLRAAAPGASVRDRCHPRTAAQLGCAALLDQIVRPDQGGEAAAAALRYTQLILEGEQLRGQPGHHSCLETAALVLANAPAGRHPGLTAALLRDSLREPFLQLQPWLVTDIAAKELHVAVAYVSSLAARYDAILAAKPPQPGQPQWRSSSEPATRDIVLRVRTLCESQRLRSLVQASGSIAQLAGVS